MGKLTNRRYYLDYNSTSPLAKSVKRWLSKGDFDFLNPSSLHTSGRKALGAVHEVERFLRSLFAIDHDIFFHSGATEGNNTIIRGWLEKAGSDANFFYGPFDHSSVKELAVLFGPRAHQIDIDHQGDLKLEQLIARIKKLGNSPVLVNYTVVNNETGVHWPLDYARKLKAECGCAVHVDASQLVGKVDKWQELAADLDAYTFSGHKFGSLKGVGFSFYARNFGFSPLLLGGTQQKGVRAGTINSAGVYSLKLALEDVRCCSKQGRLHFEGLLTELLGNKGMILCSKAKNRSNNLIYFVLFGVKTESLMAAFDLAGFDLSSGSACSSGISTKKQALELLGVDIEAPLAPVRISFAPQFTPADAKRVFKRLKKVLLGFLDQ